MSCGTSHVDIDDVGARAFRDPGPFGHPVGFAACEPPDLRSDAGRLAAQHRHPFAIDEVVARRHFGNDQARTEARRESPKGSVRNAGHGREKDAIGELNIPYLQWLTAYTVGVVHEALASAAGAS